MNPMTNVKNIIKLNELELAQNPKTSWHDMYKDSAWIFVGGLAYGLTEGDIVAVFSQYGEIVNINLVRDKKTGKIKGYCFLCYSDQRSTILAVDNFNGIKLCGRTIRVDHVAEYRLPKEHENDDEITKKLIKEGCAPSLTTSDSVLENSSQSKRKEEIKKNIKRHSTSNSSESSSEDDNVNRKAKTKKTKSEKNLEKSASRKGKKKLKRHHKKKTISKSSSEEESSSDSSSDEESSNDSSSEEASRNKSHTDRKKLISQIKIKKEKHDSGYDKFDLKKNESASSSFNKSQLQQKVTNTTKKHYSSSDSEESPDNQRHKHKPEKYREKYEKKRYHSVKKAEDKRTVSYSSDSSSTEDKYTKKLNSKNRTNKYRKDKYYSNQKSSQKKKT